MAEAMSICFYYPFEIVKVRMIAKNDTYGYKSIPDAFKKIIIADGNFGLWKGAHFFLINYIMSNTI